MLAAKVCYCGFIFYFHLHLMKFVSASGCMLIFLVFSPISEAVTSYALHLEKQHDALLDSLFEVGTYKKLYSYRHLINGFSIHISSEQAEALSRAPGVKYVEKDMKVKKLTTHTPQFLGLPTGVWPTGGGFDRAGEDIVIGFVDSGIYPKHPSFSTYNSEPYGPLPRYRGKCEIDPDTKRDFCNGKIIGAQHFAKAAIAAGAFNPTIDFASPLDGDGHGRRAPWNFSLSSCYDIFSFCLSTSIKAHMSSTT